MTKFLDQAYGVDGVAATRDMYDTWSATYEDEVAENGYATPPRCAAALRAAMEATDQPILDVGCGTGLSGVALAEAGFSVIDGIDISAEMLAEARAKTGIYRSLTHYDPAGGVPVETGAYAAIAAIGVIGAGAAPLEVLDELVGKLDPGGLLVFSFNDHTLEDPAYEARLQHYVDGGQLEQVFKAYGPHLPGKGMKSNVYVMRRL